MSEPSDTSDTVPDGGDHHEYQAAKQRDLGATDDGYAKTPANDGLDDDAGLEDAATAE